MDGITERLYHEIMCPTLTKTGPCNCQPVIVAEAPPRAEALAPSKCCGVAAPDRSGRTCDKPEGHDGDHWTYGGATLTWLRAEALAPHPQQGQEPEGDPRVVGVPGVGQGDLPRKDRNEVVSSAFRITLAIGLDEDGDWLVTSPELDGLMIHSEHSPEEALSLAGYALQQYAEAGITNGSLQRQIAQLRKGDR